MIARARKYHQEVTGEKGTIIEGHVDKETFKQDLAEAGVEVEKPAVKEFLEHITHDQRGIINMFDRVKLSLARNYKVIFCVLERSYSG